MILDPKFQNFESSFQRRKNHIHRGSVARVTAVLLKGSRFPAKLFARKSFGAFQISSPIYPECGGSLLRYEIMDLIYLFYISRDLENNFRMN